MKILIIGANGYLGKAMHTAFKDKYDITTITRQDFDLTSVKDMIEFFNGKYFDVILHCAIAGGSRLKEDKWNTMDINLCMYYNLLQCRFHYGKLINFGSGAEINTPESPYGLSKRVIAKSISEIDNFYNLRIFAVFDENELDTRFIKANIKRYINKEPIIIHQDKFMDFFYMKDLVTLVEYYILNDNLPKEINCNYDTLFSLVDIANIINELDEYNVDIEILETGPNKLYMGSFDDLGINFIGLKQGVINTYNILKNEY
jgi:dTDP-4-dehydrorhamnose reductase